MPKFLQNFAQGAVEAGTGITAAILEGLRQEKEAKQLAQRAKSQGILDSLNQARIEETNRMYQQKPAPPEKKLPLQHIFAPDGAELWVNPNTMESIPTGKNYAKPEKPTVAKTPTVKDKGMTDAQLLKARIELQKLLQPQKEWQYSVNNAGVKADSIPNPTYGANIDSALAANIKPIDLMPTVPQGATSIFPQGTQVQETPTQKADRMVTQGLMTQQEREDYRKETGF
jgi:hypothetical protein